MTEQEFILLEEAASQLEVTRATLYYYIRKLKLEIRKFPLDKHAYLAIADFNHIKSLKEEAAKRGGTSKDAA